MAKTVKSTTALLVIDMLNDFVLKGAPLEVPGARRIVTQIKRRITRARKDGVPIVYVCDKHRKDDPEFEVWPPHAVNGTGGAEIVSELTPRSSDYMVDKSTYSAFFQTKLDRLLRKLGSRKLVITGVVTEICVLYTAVGAFMRGYEVDVPESCVTGLTEQDHRFALRQIKKNLKPSQG